MAKEFNDPQTLGDYLLIAKNGEGNRKNAEANLFLTGIEVATLDHGMLLNSKNNTPVIYREIRSSTNNGNGAIILMRYTMSMSTARRNEVMYAGSDGYWYNDVGLHQGHQPQYLKLQKGNLWDTGDRNRTRDNNLTNLSWKLKEVLQKAERGRHRAQTAFPMRNHPVNSNHNYPNYFQQLNSYPSRHPQPQRAQLPTRAGSALLPNRGNDSNAQSRFFINELLDSTVDKLFGDRSGPSENYRERMRANDFGLWLSVLDELRTLTHEEKRQLAIKLGCKEALAALRERGASRRPSHRDNGTEHRENHRIDYDFYILHCISAQLHRVTDALLHPIADGDKPIKEWLDSVEPKTRKVFENLKFQTIYPPPRNSPRNEDGLQDSALLRAEMLHNFTVYMRNKMMESQGTMNRVGRWTLGKIRQAAGYN